MDHRNMARDSAKTAANAQSRETQLDGRSNVLLDHYRAIERASHDMLEAARTDKWDHVDRLERDCAALISRLKEEARETTLTSDLAQSKVRIMQRILLNDAEIRTLAEAWLEQLYGVHAGRPRTLH
jgi:flagellar protein FliT